MINKAGVVVMIIIMIFLIYILKTKMFDSFIVFLDDVVIPKSCYNYLVTNGSNYFLFNSNKILDGITNPLKFKNKLEAVNYLKKMECPDNIPFVDLVMRKSIDDPTVSYERECGKQVAPNLFDLDICATYGSDLDTLDSKYISKINKIENDKKLYSNYDIERCMIEKASKEDPKLDDTHFKAYFSQYFDRMNSNIDEKFLYFAQE